MRGELRPARRGAAAEERCSRSELSVRLGTAMLALVVAWGLACFGVSAAHAQTTESPAVSIRGSSLSVSETDDASTTDVDETKATYGVRLLAEPAADVTITPSASPSGAVTLSPPSLTFTAANWSTLQEVTVTAVADPDAGGPRREDHPCGVGCGQRL